MENNQPSQSSSSGGRFKNMISAAVNFVWKIPLFPGSSHSKEDQGQSGSGGPHSDPPKASTTQNSLFENPGKFHTIYILHIKTMNSKNFKFHGKN
jgi:hypothetical protein